MRFRLPLWVLIAALVVTPGLLLGAERSTAAAAQQCFPETGFCVTGRFLEYWLANGGLALNGYPLTSERREQLEDGKEYTVQYFERVRLELHPENAFPHDVLLGQFGRLIYPDDAPVPSRIGQTYFAETGHNLGSDFLAYWNANGGLRQFGYPISEVIVEELEDGRVYLVQYFERARFEIHPENRPPNNILLGQFGRLILAAIDAGPIVLPVVGERGVGDGFAVTVHRVLDPTPALRYLKPDSGNRWLALDVTVENTGSEEMFYSRYDATLATKDGKAYTPWLGSQEPELSVGTLQPGQSARGWINFEIPVGAELAALLYEPIRTPAAWVIFALAPGVTGIAPLPRTGSGRVPITRASGCGSRGGPGYRLPNGQCAGWDDVYSKGGSRTGGGSSGGCGSRGGPGGPRDRSGRYPSR